MVATVAVLTGGAGLLAGCGEAPPPATAQPKDKTPKEQVQAYENVFDCVANSGLSEAQCLEARTKATALAESAAPRFEGKEDCEAEFKAGSCVEQGPPGHRYFSPFITGFMVSKLLNGGQRDYTPLFRRKGDAGFSTANGYRLGYAGAPGKYFAAARAMEQARSVPAVKRASSAAVTRGGLAMRSDGFSVKGASAGG